MISPNDLQEACRLFGKLRLAMRLRRFDTGLLVVQSDRFEEEAVIARLLHHLHAHGPLTPVELSDREKISLTLAHEQLLVGVFFFFAEWLAILIIILRVHFRTLSRSLSLVVCFTLSCRATTLHPLTN